MSTVEPEQLLTVQRAADFLDISKRKLEREIASGAFPRPLKIGRAIRIRPDHVRTYLDYLEKKNQ